MIKVITMKNGEGFVIHDGKSELAVITLLNRTSKGARVKVDISPLHSADKLGREGQLIDKIEINRPCGHN